MELLKLTSSCQLIDAQIISVTLKIITKKAKLKFLKYIFEHRYTCVLKLCYKYIYHFKLKRSTNIQFDCLCAEK